MTEKKGDRIKGILNAVGVVYTHRNEDLIAESAIEGQRHKNAVEVCLPLAIPLVCS